MSATKPAKLYTQITVDEHKLPNRIALAPMTRGRADMPGNLANSIMAEYYVQRANAGLVMTEGTFPCDAGIGWYGAPGIYTDAHVEAWKPVVAAVHDAGATFACQLWHCGRASHSDFRPDVKDGRGVAPSAIAISDGSMIHTPNGKKDQEVPHELTTEEVKGLAEEMKNAAECAKKAGFDMIEVHCANGYLFNSFLEPKTNKRTDMYGGSYENNFRVVAEVLTAVTSVYPSGSVSVRISPNGSYNDMGSPGFREAYLEYVKMLKPFNLGILHVMIGLGFGWHGKGTNLKPMSLAEIREVYGYGVIMANIGYSKESAEADVESGDCDMVSFGRPYISNPDLVNRFQMDVPLNPDAKLPDYYYAPGSHISKEQGYTTFPSMNQT
jgi:N-ethylmaleimide reductase